MAKGPVLTRKQFKKKYPKGNYPKYLRAQTKAARHPVAPQPPTMQSQGGYDWLAPQSPQDLMAQIGQLTDPIYGQGMQQQLSSLGQSSYSNLGQSAAAASAGAGRQIGQQIMGVGEQAAAMLRPIAGEIGGYYGQAQGRQSAADAALVHELNTAATAGSQNVVNQLAAAGQVTQPGVDVAGFQGGAADAMAGFGSAQLSQLIGQGAAAQSWAAGLPAVAAMQAQADASLAGTAAGLQGNKAQIDAQRAQADANFELQKTLLQMQQQGQASQADLFQQLSAQEFQKAVTRLGYQSDQQKLVADALAQQAGYANAAAMQEDAQAFTAQQNAQSQAASAAQSAADNQAAMERAILGHTPAPGELTPAQKAQAKRLAAALTSGQKFATDLAGQTTSLNQWYYGGRWQNQPPAPGSPASFGDVQKRTTKQPVYRQGVNMIKLYTLVYNNIKANLPKATRKRLRGLTQRALASAGINYTPPRAASQTQGSSTYPTH